MIADNIRKIKKNWVIVSGVLVLIAIGISTASILFALGFRNSDANEHIEFVLSEQVLPANLENTVYLFDRASSSILIDSQAISTEQIEELAENTLITQIRTYADTFSFIPITISFIQISLIIAIAILGIDLYKKVFDREDIELTASLKRTAIEFTGLLLAPLLFVGMLSISSFFKFVEVRLLDLGLLSIILVAFVVILKRFQIDVGLGRLELSFALGCLVVLYALNPYLFFPIVFLIISFFLGTLTINLLKELASLN